MTYFHLLAATMMVLAVPSGAAAQMPPAAEDVPVTVDNFKRAETDLYFGTPVKQAGGIGKFFHYRQPMEIDNQTVVRANRDTLYSAAVVDLAPGPVTITLPEVGNRFRSMLVINEDHYVVGDVEYDAGTYTYDKEEVGTRYVLFGLRTLVDPESPEDVRQVHSLQDAIKITPTGSGTFEIPSWDQESQKKVRDALLVLASTIPDFKGAFGSKEDVDPIRHLIGTAAAWGGNPDKDAVYLNVTPEKNDGSTVHTLKVAGTGVPVDGFWSISLYNAEGYFEKNGQDAYSVNNITAARDPDGAIIVQFGGCDGDAPNCLPIMEGWNYTVRLYRPRAEILDGSWIFPEAQPTN